MRRQKPQISLIKLTRKRLYQSHNVKSFPVVRIMQILFLPRIVTEWTVSKERNTGMDRYTGRSNIEYKKDKLTFSSIFSLPISWIRTSRGKVVPVNSVISSSILFAPNVTVRDQNGKRIIKDPNKILSPVRYLY